MRRLDVLKRLHRYFTNPLPAHEPGDYRFPYLDTAWSEDEEVGPADIGYFDKRMILNDDVPMEGFLRTLPDFTWLPERADDVLGAFAYQVDGKPNSIRSALEDGSRVATQVYHAELTIRDLEMLLTRREDRSYLAAVTQYYEDRTKDAPDGASSKAECRASMLSMPSSNKRDRNEMGHQRLLEHLHSDNEEFREVLPHPHLLYLGRHREAVGNTTSTPPFCKTALSFLCKNWPSMARRMKEMEAQPSTNFVQLIHLSRFGQQNPWRPCGKILLLFICALTMALEVFRGRSITMSDLQPRGEESSFKKTSSGFDGSYIDELSNFLASDRLVLGTFGTERHRGRSHRMSKQVHDKLSALAAVAYERLMLYGILPPLTFALSTGRSAVRELYNAGKFGGRLVWNLSKLSMYTLFGGATLWKEAMKFRPGSPYLIGYGPEHGRAGQLGDRLKKYELFIALDLPRCDAQFQTFLTGSEKVPPRGAPGPLLGRYRTLPTRS